MASSEGEFSRLLRKSSLSWRRRERGTAAGRRKLQDFGEDFSLCPAPGAWRCCRKEKIAGFWRRFLPLPGAGSVALLQEGENCRILEKISPFARRREHGAAAGKEKIAGFWRKFLPLPGGGGMRRRLRTNQVHS
ncbi:MAG: hypothetical protein VZQ80_01825 [Lachnospiraceae bacterium]|nr:hypothetical protein [Lachnospiraceae bacterium]